jgi:hypothetical protein
MLNLFKSEVRTVYGRGADYDAVGIEVEMEPRERGQRLVLKDYPDNWQFKGDGSLRNNGIEAVSQVCKFQYVPMFLKELNESIDMSILDSTSPRTSIHVHVNMGHRNVAQVFNLYIMNVLLEDLLLSLSGRSRKGNNFALSSQAAESLNEYLLKCITYVEAPWLQENDRYAGLNLVCLKGLGTMEFRTMRGLTNVQDINDWVDIIMDIYRVAASYDTPKILLQRDLNDLVPYALTKYFTREKIIETMESNYSNVIPFWYRHKTHWDLDDPESDIRMNPDFVKYLKEGKGCSEKDVLRMNKNNLDSYYKKFKRGDKIKEPDLSAYTWAVNFIENRPLGLRLGGAGVVDNEDAMFRPRIPVPDPQWIVVDEEVNIPDEDIEVPR